MNLDVINNKLKEILSQRRLDHSINVAICAVKLSEIYGYDKERAYIAGLVHDCAKCLNKNEVDFYVSQYKIELDDLEKDNLALSHSVIGSYIARYEFNIEDEEIISSVKYHTTGKENMNLIEKIIYMADLIEEGRNFNGVYELRELSFNNKLDQALLISFNNTIKFVIDNEQIIHPRTVEARNYLMKQK
ncbi:MAG: bis(5'-nucleosyl)-tetraphosphatase (symmetrical) YqeK [Romboutsia sp.]|uniref:bis(5'-nucleosyl)-tetraphosphatase (symmetrical) YqeK n=1 Tax=Romboutsia sp. TaxID=1965302 RepID=UPI003F3663F2